MERIRDGIDYLVNEVQKYQSQDGAWRLIADNGPMTDAYFIILYRALGLSSHEDLIARLAERLLRIQNEDGTWSVYPDEPTINISATIEAYYALICSGYIPQNDMRLVRTQSALETIKAMDNKTILSKLTKSTRAFFAGIGQLPWPKYNLPAGIVLAPRWSPVHFYRFVGYARAHIAPVLMASMLDANIALNPLPELSSLVPIFGTQSVPETKHKMLNHIIPRAKILDRLEQYLLSQIEKNGTLCGYASATFFMIMALIARGYSPDDPIILNAINGIASFAHNEDEFSHIQNADAAVWNTGLMSYVLQAALTHQTSNLSSNKQNENDAIRRSLDYLLSQQQIETRYLPNFMTKERYPYSYTRDVPKSLPSMAPGGWGFSHVNTLVPDVDDTCAALRALHRAARANWHGKEAKAFTKGTKWLWSMQNSDGGFPAFERNVDNKFFTKLRVDGAEGVLTDPSSADLTGRTLEFLGNYCYLTAEHPKIKRAVKWLLSHQESNGSWKGRWGICYIYGTWAAITGLCAVGVPKSHPQLQKARSWLLAIQKPDGGFGESCQSDALRRYIPLQHSTISQTAWALDALIAVSDTPDLPINRAADSILKQMSDIRCGKEKASHSRYPTGGGLPGSFYIQYHSYNFIWPLLSLSHYKNKYGT